MSFRRIILLAVVAGLVVPIGALAQHVNPYGQRHTVSDRTAVAGALLPVDDDTSESWGRVMVADRSYSEGTMRDLVCHLFDMDVETDFILMIDEIEVGLMTTDLEGEGWIHLQTPERDYPALPEDLPTVEELSMARILDVTGTVVLEGELLDMGSPLAGAHELVYLEKAPLISDLEDSMARGRALVARDVDDVQYFGSQAVGLAPRTAFIVEVDGELADVVTSNAGGVAELKLSTGEYGDVLPGGLQPIEDLRLVEWFSEDDRTLVLSGSFVGQNQLGFGGPNGDGEGDGNGDGDCDGEGGNGDGDCDGEGGNGDGDCDGDGECDGEGGNGGDGSGDHGGSGDDGGGDHGGGGSGDGSGDGDCDGTGGGNP